MTPARWKVVEEVFEAVRDVEPGAETTELPADSTVWWAV